MQSGVLAYALVRMIEERLDVAGLDLGAKQDLAGIKRAPLS